MTSHIAVYTSDAEQVTGRNRACGLTFLGVHNRTIHSPRISPSLRHLARGFLPFESAHKDVCARYTGVTRREDVYACTPSVRTKVPSQSKNCLGWPKKHAHRTKCVEARSWVYRNRKCKVLAFSLLLNCIKIVHPAPDESLTFSAIALQAFREVFVIAKYIM